MRLRAPSSLIPFHGRRACKWPPKGHLTKQRPPLPHAQARRKGMKGNERLVNRQVVWKVESWAAGAKGAWERRGTRFESALPTLAERTAGEGKGEEKEGFGRGVKLRVLSIYLGLAGEVRGRQRKTREAEESRGMQRKGRGMRKERGVRL